MDDAKHQELMDVLKTLLKIQALSAVCHLATKREKVFFLSEAGLSPKEISSIVGSSAGAVSQTIYEAKKKAGKEM